MIIKQNPEDFQVEERTRVQPDPAGAFAFYRLEKSGWTTHDALSLVRRRWRIDARRLSYGGLKDRHARTVQHFTLFRGPQRNLTQQGIHVTYLGQLSHPFAPEHIAANRFQLVLRRLSPAETSHALAQLPAVRALGVPNYFDDQRFGSVAGGGPFVGRLLVLGQYEEALKQALAAPYPFDRRAQKEEKKTLHQHWGDWAACKASLPRGHARSLVDYLVHHPADFRGAIERLRPELRGLYLSAYQSHLWNRTLAAFLEAQLQPAQLVRVALAQGEVPMHAALEPQQLALLRATDVPLCQPRLQAADWPVLQPHLEEVLRQEGIELAQLRLKGLKTMFFSRGVRPALNLPEQLAWSAATDDAHDGKEKITLEFDLPRGGYATLIVKRITMPDGTA